MQSQKMLSPFGIKKLLLNFFLGEYFGDAFRNTLTIVAPIVLFFYLDKQQTAIGVGVGALLISLTDLPGNRIDKFKSAILSNVVFLLTALCISWCLGNAWLTAAAFFFLTLLWSMLSVLGMRLSVIGTMAIILSTFTMGLHPPDPLMFSLYIFVGGIWYYSISLLQTIIWPYRSLNHAIFECVRAMSSFLVSKSKCYDQNFSLDECYRESIMLHVRVTEKQDLVRHLLLGDKTAMRTGNRRGGQLLRTARNVIALYEQATAINYDYQLIRDTLDPVRYMPLLTKLIQMLAEEMEDLSHGFLNKKLRGYKNNQRAATFTSIKNNLEKFSFSESREVSEMLQKILQNVQVIQDQIADVRQNKSVIDVEVAEDLVDYRAYISADTVSLSGFFSKFSLKSPVYRFSLRLALSFLVGYSVSLLFPMERYSYWMLLTIVIVARPRFAVTWKRNNQRLIGTLAGVVIGFLSVIVVNNVAILLILSIVFLLGFFTFNRTKYEISVLCITPAVIICLSLYHGHIDYILSERIYYTIAGCFIAFAGTYLFPIWEASQLSELMKAAITANIEFIKATTIKFPGATKAFDAGLARKNAHLKLARLSEAIQYMYVEPKRRGVDFIRIEKLHAINYRINGVITSLYLSASEGDDWKNAADLAHRVVKNLTAANVMLFEGKGMVESSADEELPSNNGSWNHLMELSKKLVE
ncbi:MAG: hypothetical protein EOO92_15160 [Pedobacter sp.]|nr:MAG: hypothetical protein EOO92_15160 [Pedobacter sp.]